MAELQRCIAIFKANMNHLYNEPTIMLRLFTSCTEIRGYSVEVDFPCACNALVVNVFGKLHILNVKTVFKIINNEKSFE